MGKIQNKLNSVLSNFLIECDGKLDPETAIRFFADTLIAAEYDSEVVVKVLERFESLKHKDICREVARDIKVSEGW